MPKQRSKEETGTASASNAGAVSKFQTFTTETVHRSQLAGAKYNPRHISQRNKLKLRETMRNVGLVQPIVWNKRTGNIVGGHQRISQLDALEGSADYSLTVAVLDVAEAREKELNILLNNQEVCGDFDLDKLKEMLTEEISLVNTGFDHAEFMKMFGEAPSQPNADHQDEISEQLKGVKAAYEKLTAMNRTKDDTDFYNV
ncbi:MAG: ParB N-terminal domain-containing protein, partial [Verrucomicrobiota bacterium]